MTNPVDIKSLLIDIASSLSRRVDFEENEDDTDILDSGWYALLHCAVLIIGELQAQFTMDKRSWNKLELENKKLLSELADRTAELLKLQQMTGRLSTKSESSNDH